MGEAAQARVIQGHVPAGLAGLSPLGRLPAAGRLELAIGLPLRNREGLTNLLRELYDPASAQYRRFLTPTQFAQAFGPTVDDYQAVTAFAQANGFTVTGTHSNRVLLNVSAAAGDIERAFHLAFRRYQHPSEARTFYAPDADPAVDAAVPILNISGLDNFQLPRPLLKVSPRPPGTMTAQPAVGSGPGGTYLGKDFRNAYVPGVGLKGAGQKVGLLEFDGYYANDITAYESLTGLPNVPLTKVLLDGFNGSPGSANIEVALDIEMAVAMAPGLAGVIVYEAGPSGFPNDILNRMAIDNAARQISSSWTWGGGVNATTDQIFQQFAAQGQSFFQASGDSGAYVGPISPQDAPADNPYITVVGGTTLATGSGGAWASETTWNWYNHGTGTNGSGGGISTSYSIPTWQQGVSMSANQGSTTMRNIPDVALTADNIWVLYNNGGSQMVGGTSCSAPLWAAFTALVNQQAQINGQSPVGFINPTLYALATSTNYSTLFHDLISGNNTNLYSPAKFSARPGYDLCTGWGSPAGRSLMNALAGPAVPIVVSNNAVLAVEGCPNGAVDPGELVTIDFPLTNIGSGNTTNLVATLQVGAGITSPSGPQTYGVLIASGAAVSRPFTFTAVGVCGGRVTATLQLQDGGASLGSVSFDLRLGKLITAQFFSEIFDGVAVPALPPSWTTTVVAGVPVNWATSNGLSDTAPNSAFGLDAKTAGLNELVSPVIPITSASAQLSFRHNYHLASHTSSHSRTTTYYDGGVLEIAIGNGGFADIVAAGGSFAVGGYNCTVASGNGNALGGRQAWGGNSGGWITTTVNLPAAAAGQNIQLRWGLGTGNNTTYTAVGWYVDTLTLQDTHSDCCLPSADLAVTHTLAPNPAITGQNCTLALVVTNLGPASAASVTVTDTLPANVSFVSASPGCVNSDGMVVCTVGTLAGGAASNLTVTVVPLADGLLTNLALVASSTSDPNLGNNTASATVTAATPPAIDTEPAGQTAIAGSSASFAVDASGTAPLSYQWTLGGTNLSGATGSSLLLSNVDPSQAGNYAVVVGNLAGAATSTVATLTVLTPPAITLPPASQTVAAGTNPSFQVAATGTDPLSYQWLFGGTNLPAATGRTLGLPNVDPSQTGSYSVMVTNIAGAVTSTVATLTVLIPPSVTLQPSNQTVVAGTNMTFQIAASGSDPLAYQWIFAGTNLPGATDPVLTLTNVQSGVAGSYSVLVTNAVGSVTSLVAQLDILLPPALTLQPISQSVLAGTNVSFQASVFGADPLVYQWFFNITNPVGANTNILTLTTVQPAQAGGYSLLVTNMAGSATSMVATLVIAIPPSLLTNVTMLGTGVSISIQSLAGVNYALDYKDHLNDPGWTALPTPWPGTGGLLVLQDTNAVVPTRFYRVRSK